MIGICMSIRTTSKLPASALSDPLFPSSAHSTVAPARWSTSEMSFRFEAPSSTSSTRMAGKCSDASPVLRAAPDATAIFDGSVIRTPSSEPASIVTVKVLPFPYSLATVRLPPRASAICRLIDRPSPVPPNRRVIDVSACAKGWKIRSSTSGFTPMPESITPRR